MVQQTRLNSNKLDPRAPRAGITEDELRAIMEAGREEGVIASEEKEMIDNVFALGYSQVKDVMIPRVDVVFADIGSSYQDIRNLFEEHRLTRLPVYEKTPDSVVGILNLKDLLLYHQDEEFNIRDYLREPFFTHKFKSTTELLTEMRRDRAAFAVVLDEYGVTAGIITVEDIVEKIVGDLRDEYDEPDANALQKLGAGEYLVEGSYNLANLNSALGISLTSKDYDSIGGYLVGLLDHFPKEGEACTNEDGFRLVAERVDHNRIETVHLYFPEEK